MIHSLGMKNQITVRGLDAETESRLRGLANRRSMSMNKAAVMLIRKGAGLKSEDEGPETVGASLDSFVGSWTPEQEREFLRSIRDMEQIDKELWQ
jgi:hypothetical protein